MYLVNVSKKGSVILAVRSREKSNVTLDYLRKSNKYLPKIAEFFKEKQQDVTILPLSCEFELELLDLDAGGQLEQYLKDNPTHKSALNRILKTGYHALGLIHFFTSGKDEVRGWTIR